jgi:hypothetical protein
MIVPPIQVTHNEDHTIWVYTVTFTQDTSA